MARNIVKEYIDYDKKFLREYIDIITEKKLNAKICDMIIDTYVNVRYFDMYEHIKDYPIYNVEHYITENFNKQFSDKNKKKNIPLVLDSMIVLRYVFLYERYHKDKKSAKKLEFYEDKIKNKYDSSKIVVSNLIKMIKDNIHKKEKFMSGLLSNDFYVTKIETNNKYVYDLSFDNNVKIPDLFSDIAIDRVYNSGIIYEDRMTVFYLLTIREVLDDMINYRNEIKYLVDFPDSLIGKRNKLSALLKLIDLDYLKERMILKVLYSEYLEKKEEYDKLIHDGYSLAVIIDIDLKNSVVLLRIFTYIIINDSKYEKVLDDFDNVIFAK